MAYTISQILQISNICVYLAADDEAQGNVFRGSYERPGLSRLIYLITQGVNWLNNYNPSDTTLYGKAMYLFSLCMPFVGRALQIIGSGGSGTIVNPATGVISTIVSKTVEFKVGDSGSLLNAGDTSLVLNYTSILNASVSVVVDGVPLPITQSDRLSFTPIYSTSSVTLNFNAGAIAGQVYVIMFLQYVTV